MSEPPNGGSWEDDALCKEYDSSMWFLSTDPVLNKNNFETAEVICSKCTVFSECWQAATLTDKKVTMRAGAWPTEYKAPPRKLMDKCANGHDLTTEGAKDAAGRCRRCTRDRGRAWRERQRVAKSKGMQ